MEGANPKETKKLQDQLRGIYKENWQAMKSYNAREAADSKSQAKATAPKKQKT